ncbi:MULTISPECIES: hypothetical protein [Tsukamurella]|uniref:Uncharacterized protein n=2 Tax=Tsukamurella TaxID=2060 RepID=A0A5C5RZF2_9ACTN|nr:MULTISPECIES: hypothetical protein [Tsukamurella]NMD54587.1 hypothetical protein [Tsukamurella columbiensis]TWS28507.1 hypothetical protein FK530_12885 [Tsukamurella conjunctivitidis]
MSEIRRAPDPRRAASSPDREVRVSTILPDGEIVAVPVEPLSRQHDAKGLARASERPPTTD